MPRRPRVSFEGGIYHVFNRFARGVDLFSDPEEAIGFLEILRKQESEESRKEYEKLDGDLVTHHTSRT